MQPTGNAATPTGGGQCMPTMNSRSSRRSANSQSSQMTFHQADTFQYDSSVVASGIHPIPNHAYITIPNVTVVGHDQFQIPEQPAQQNCIQPNYTVMNLQQHNNVAIFQQEAPHQAPESSLQMFPPQLNNQPMQLHSLGVQAQSGQHMVQPVAIPAPSSTFDPSAEDLMQLKKNFETFLKKTPRDIVARHPKAYEEGLKQVRITGHLHKQFLRSQYHALQSEQNYMKSLLEIDELFKEQDRLNTEIAQLHSTSQTMLNEMEENLKGRELDKEIFTSLVEERDRKITELEQSNLATEEGKKHLLDQITLLQNSSMELSGEVERLRSEKNKLSEQLEDKTVNLTAVEGERDNFRGLYIEQCHLVNAKQVEVNQTEELLKEMRETNSSLQEQLNMLGQSMTTLQDRLRQQREALAEEQEAKIKLESELASDRDKHEALLQENRKLQESLEVAKAEYTNLKEESVQEKRNLEANLREEIDEIAKKKAGLDEELKALESHNSSLTDDLKTIGDELNDKTATLTSYELQLRGLQKAKKHSDDKRTDLEREVYEYHKKLHECIENLGKITVDKEAVDVELKTTKESVQVLLRARDAQLRQQFELIRLREGEKKILAAELVQVKEKNAELYRVLNLLGNWEERSRDRLKTVHRDFNGFLEHGQPMVIREGEAASALNRPTTPNPPMVQLKRKITPRPEEVSGRRVPPSSTVPLDYIDLTVASDDDTDFDDNASVSTVNNIFGPSKENAPVKPTEKANKPDASGVSTLSRPGAQKKAKKN